MKTIAFILFFMGLSLPQAKADWSFGAHIYFDNPYAYSTYPGAYYGSSYGLYPLGSFYNTFYDSPARYQSVTPPNMGLYQNIEAYGSYKIRTYYQQKLASNPEAVPSPQTQAPLEVPSIETLPLQ